jgi:hypothetical protein
MCNVQLKLNKVVLTSSIDYYKKAIKSRNANLINSQSIFHDLNTISMDMKFNMKQFPNSLNAVKKCIKQKKLLYIKSEDLDNLKEKHGISRFELTIFYHFEKIGTKGELQEFSVIRPKSKVHNLFVVKTTQPILLLYNPFQHNFED